MHQVLLFSMHVLRVKGGIKGIVEYEDGASAAKIDIIISMGSWREKKCVHAHTCIVSPVNTKVDKPCIQCNI